MPPIGNRYRGTSSSYSSRLSRLRWKFSLSLALHWSKTFSSFPSFPSPYFLLVVFLSHLFIHRISVCQFLLLIHPREKLFKGRSLLPEPPLNFSRPFASLSSSHSALSASARSKSILATTISIGPSITMNVIAGITGSKPIGNCTFRIL